MKHPMTNKLKRWCKGSIALLLAAVTFLPMVGNRARAITIDDDKTITMYYWEPLVSVSQLPQTEGDRLNGTEYKILLVYGDDVSDKGYGKAYTSGGFQYSTNNYTMTFSNNKVSDHPNMSLLSSSVVEGLNKYTMSIGDAKTRGFYTMNDMDAWSIEFAGFQTEMKDDGKNPKYPNTKGWPQYYLYSRNNSSGSRRYLYATENGGLNYSTSSGDKSKAKWTFIPLNPLVDSHWRTWTQANYNAYHSEFEKAKKSAVKMDQIVVVGPDSDNPQVRVLDGTPRAGTVSYTFKDNDDKPANPITNGYKVTSNYIMMPAANKDMTNDANSISETIQYKRKVGDKYLARLSVYDAYDGHLAYLLACKVDGNTSAIDLRNKLYDGLYHNYEFKSDGPFRNTSGFDYSIVGNSAYYIKDGSWNDRMIVVSEALSRGLVISKNDSTKNYQLTAPKNGATSKDYTKFQTYIGRERKFSALVSNYTVASGDTLNLGVDKNGNTTRIFIPEGVTLTIEPGAVVSVQGTLFNNGTIKNYGTLVINDGATLSQFKPEKKTESGKIENYGAFTYTTSGSGDSYKVKETPKTYKCKDKVSRTPEGTMFVRPGGYTYFANDYGSLYFDGGASCINQGTMIMGSNLYIFDSTFENQSTGKLYLGSWIQQEKMIDGNILPEDIRYDYSYTSELYVSAHGTFMNYGTMYGKANVTDKYALVIDTQVDGGFWKRG